MQQFANAYERILSIQSTLNSDLEGVSDEIEARALQENAQKDMVRAVEAQGLSIDQYNEIIVLMQEDMVLRQQVLDRIL